MRSRREAEDYTTVVTPQDIDQIIYFKALELQMDTNTQ